MLLTLTQHLKKKKKTLTHNFIRVCDTNQSAFNFLSHSHSVAVFTLWYAHPPALPHGCSLRQQQQGKANTTHTRTNTQDAVWEISPWYRGQRRKRGRVRCWRGVGVLHESAVLRGTVWRHKYSSNASSYTNQPFTQSSLFSISITFCVALSTCCKEMSLHNHQKAFSEGWIWRRHEAVQ